MRFSAKLRSPWPVVALLVLLSGCAKTIPNTDVPDTPENRDVITFMERYRHAIEERSVEGILALTSPLYLDDFGTPNGTDDIDYDALAQKLLVWRERLLDVRNYNIRYRRIRFVQERVFVEYTYTAYFRVVTTGEDSRWARRIADHRAVLSRDPESGDLAFLSGL